MNLSIVLEHWVKKQNKTIYEISTEENKLIGWNVDGIKRPTQEEIIKIIEEYESDINSQKSKSLTDKGLILEKLGLTEEEWKTLNS